jgi:hypothetical protein
MIHPASSQHGMTCARITLTTCANRTFVGAKQPDMGKYAQADLL